MKKILLTIVAVIMMIGTAIKANAQNEFYPYTIGLNFGLGCGTVNHPDNHFNNIFVPSLEFAGDLSFLPNVINANGSVSGGIYFGIGAGSRKEHQSTHDIKYTDNYWRFGTRGALHYSWVRDLDTYAGIAFGFKRQAFKKDSQDGDSTPNNDFDFDSYGFGGARYKFNHSVAVFSEVATTHFAWFQIGISVLINN